VQNIINPRPKKIILGRQIKKTRQRLVQINAAKSCVKETYEPLAAGRQDHQTDNAEDNMKHIVGWRSAGKTLGGNNEAGNAD
jgi:hypothetical protein